MNNDFTYIFPRELESFLYSVLEAHGVRSDAAHCVSEGLVQTSLRGVDSHGIRLFPHYVEALKAGRLNPGPAYRFEKTAAAVGRLDGDHTFGHAAGSEGMKYAVQLAEEAGTGMVAVYNSSHFGAAAYYALQAARRGFIGLSFTHADSLMHSFGGTRPYFGTNPLCMAVPCGDEEPFCLDMATSRVTWNKILYHREVGESIPVGWGVDEQGREATDPHQVRSLQPIGEYKGFGLAMMIEILCALLTGMPFGRHISRMYADPIQQKRFLGHFFMALCIDCFVDAKEFKSRLKQLMAEVREEQAADPDQPVMVPGDPEKKAAVERARTGIPIPAFLWEKFREYSRQIDIEITGIVKR
jgi:ureidoglycolate dehydrogenase (NAD+)